MAEKTTGITFFVATYGNDSWTGEGIDCPFATFKKARDAVREVKAKGQPINVIIRGGKYYLDETLILSSKDSGTLDLPITYMAYPGEKPILSGGRRIIGWKPSDFSAKILQCNLPEAKGGIRKFRQLFFNGKRQIRARYPNLDMDNPLYGGWIFPVTAEENSFSAFRYKSGTFNRRWAKPTDAEVFMLHSWGPTTIMPIKKIDEENLVITLSGSVKDFNVFPWFIPTPIDSKYRFYVENVLEELDRPGEWCLDSEEGKLYFWPPENMTEDSEVVVPVLSCLIDLQGASWINISGLTFTETDSGENMHREGYEGYGAMFPVGGWKYCGEALRMKGAEHCCVEKNHFYAVGGNGIYMEDYNSRNIIQHNEISYAGACGVVLIGSRYPHPAPHHPIYNQVTDNHIHHCGVYDKYIAGVFLGVSDGNIIGHNRIEYMPHHAINLGNSGYGRNIVEYNEIHHTCLETYDNTAINTWMEDPADMVLRDTERSGHVIRFNFITDTRGCVLDEKGNLVPDTTNAHGIYLDNFASNCFVYGNIVVRCGAVGIVVNGGKNNVIENNIIVNCKYQLRTWSPSMWAPQIGDFMMGNHYCKNIFYWSRSDSNLYLFYHWTDRVLAQSDYNLFFNTGTGEYKIEGDRTLPLAEWQKMSYDRHSLIADPMFLDPENDNYELDPKSPALKLGFQSIDVGNIGIRKNV